MTVGLRHLSVQTFGRLAGEHQQRFLYIKKKLLQANMEYTLHEWLSMAFFFSFVAGIIGLAISLFVSLLVSLPLAEALFYSILLSAAFFCISFASFYLYPGQMSKSVEQSVESEMPFVLQHMASIASAGITLENMFHLLSNFDEYKVTSKYSRMVVRNIKSLGMSSSKAMGHIISITPSQRFRQLLIGMQSIIEKGGSLNEYLSGMAEKGIFEYRLKKEEYSNLLSMYAEVYTALLIAAPLIMVIVLSLTSATGEAFIGMGIGELLFLLTFLVIPLLNAGFILFIHFTRPE
ncbi:MAG: type II secretion system F family protein [Candidatus Aenigmarchaeota archaeon]|nr:type II secretion system F family protein [Candidatus Aenigmarchaeota archaeon]